MADTQKKSYNLFDKDNPDIVEYYTNSTTGIYTYSQNTRSVIIHCQPNKTYSATKSVQGTAPRFSLSCYDNYPQENDIATAKEANNNAMQITLTTTANSKYLVLFFYYLNPPNVSEIQQIMDTLMVNEGQPLPYEPYGWIHSLRKLTTATEAVENPLYSDGTAITAYTIKGNTVQNGTPSPQNPVMPNGVGNKTANLLDTSGAVQGYLGNDGTIGQSTAYYTTDYIPVKSETNYRYTLTSNFGGARLFRVSYYNSSKNFINNSTSSVFGDGDWSVVWTTPANTAYIRLSYINPADTTKADTYKMMSEGSTALPYEPFGYKIPISNGQQTTNIYLGSTQTVRQIKKYVLTGNETVRTYDTTYERIFVEIPNFVTFGNRATPIISTHYQGIYDERPIGNVPMNSVYSGSVGDYGIYIKEDGYTSSTDFKAYLAAQYAAGTPVTIWYAISNSETGIVNEPLMKIGDYSDTLSNAAQIPTTDGANTITVDTTVQPSEFTATWTGWHDSSVKEYDGSDWQ